jgi:recombination protein RecA
MRRNVSPVDESNYEEIVNALEKKYEGTVLRGDEHDVPARIPTGSLELDYITGGGIPMGRYTRMYGGFSSTKTRTCWSIIAEAQSMGLNCVYYDVEKQYHREAVERAGIDPAQLTVVGGTTIEEIGEKLEALMGVAHLHVIDSCSNAVSIDELDADLTAWRPGLMARAWGKVFRRAHERFDQKENTVVLVDQLRTNFGKGHTTEEPPGGKFLNFISSMNLSFRRGKWLWYDKNGYLVEEGANLKTLSGDNEPDGRRIHVRCEKSRVGRPELSAVMQFDLRNYEFDYDFEYLKAIKHLEWVERKGSWYTFNGNGKGEIRKQGDAGLRELLTEVPDLKERLYSATMDLLDTSR